MTAKKDSYTTQDIIDSIGMAAELKGETCGLNHGNYECDTAAVDWISIPMGYQLEDGVAHVNTFYIPVCRECMETLYTQDKTWILIYCLTCNSSAWRIRSLTNYLSSEDMIKWVNECPHCRSRS